MEQPTRDPEVVVYDSASVSRVLGSSRTKVKIWIADGRLPARRLPDGRIVVLREELLEMLRSLPRP